MGSRLPLLCVPGTLCDRRVFEPVLANLPSQAAAHVVLGGAVTSGAAADAILADAPPRFVAVGFSLGGFVVADLIEKAPERVAAAVLIGSNVHPDAPQNAPLRREQAALAQAQGMRSLIDRLWPSYVGAASQDRGELKRLLLDMANDAGAHALRAQAEIAISRPDRRSWAARLQTPLLVVCGAEDALCPRERYEAAAASPAAQLSVIPDAGHFVLLENPQAVAAAMQQWLSTIPDLAELTSPQVRAC